MLLYLVNRLRFHSEIRNRNRNIIPQHNKISHKRTFSGRRCLIPTITLIFEDIDYAQTGEYLEIYTDHTFTNNIAQCTSPSNQCDRYSSCSPSLNIDSTAYLEIGLFKPATISPNCGTPPRVLKANITVTCGSLPSIEVDETFQIDLSPYHAMNPPPDDYLHYIHHISTNEGTSVWGLYDSTFTVINGKCYEPALSLTFENNDFGTDHEWIEIYSPDLVTTNVTRCGHLDGVDNNCGVYSNCLNNYILYEDEYEGYDEIPVGILKSNTVQNHYCDITLDTYIILRCSINEYTILKTVDVSKSIYNVYNISSIQSTASNKNDIRYDIHITFINGACSNPELTSIKFQSSQYLDIYTTSNITNLWSDAYFIKQCHASNSQCDAWTECVIQKDLTSQYNSPSINELHIGIVNSKEVKNSTCGYPLTLNAELTITCLNNPTSPTTAPPTISPVTTRTPTSSSSKETTDTPSPTQSLPPTSRPTSKTAAATPTHSQFYPSYDSPSIAPTFEDTQDLLTSDTGNSAEFDWYLLLYAAGLVVFGICIGILAMFLYKKHKHRKEGKRTKNGSPTNKGKLTAMPVYQSLKSIEKGTSNDTDDAEQNLAKVIQEGEMDFVIADGELPPSLDDRDNLNMNDEDSIEAMFVNNESSHITAGSGQSETPSGNTKGLPKIEPAISLVSLNEAITAETVDSNYFNYCQECGLEKDGNIDDGDGLFYCFDCWKQYDDIGIITKGGDV